MQVLGTVQGDCNLLDRLMLWGIVTPLTLPDGDCNPKASPRFPLKWEMRTRKKLSYLRVRSPLSAVLSAVRMSAFST